MLSLTRKADYALVALAYLGHRHDQKTGPASARFIADEYKLPLPLLMNILKELASAHLLTSTRGAAGGYMLSKAPADISILQIIEVIEGPLRVTLCSDEENPSDKICDVEPNCPIRNPIRRLHTQLASFLQGMTLADLINESEFEKADNQTALNTEAPVLTPAF